MWESKAALVEAEKYTPQAVNILKKEVERRMEMVLAMVYQPSLTEEQFEERIKEIKEI